MIKTLISKFINLNEAWACDKGNVGCLVISGQKLRNLFTGTTVSNERTAIFFNHPLRMRVFDRQALRILKFIQSFLPCLFTFTDHRAQNSINELCRTGTEILPRKIDGLRNRGMVGNSHAQQLINTKTQDINDAAFNVGKRT